MCFICVVKFIGITCFSYFYYLFCISGSVVIFFFHTWLVLCIFFVFLVNPAKNFLTSLILSENPCLVARVILDETSVIIFVFLLLYIKGCPLSSLASFKIFSLLLVFSKLIMMCWCGFLCVNLFVDLLSF